MRHDLFRRVAIPGMIGGVLGAYVLTQVDANTVKPFVLTYLAAIGLFLIWRGFHYPPEHKAPRIVEPLGLVGAVPVLLAFNQPFGFNAILGLIGLAGILMRNTLILTEQIKENRAAGLDDYHAVIEATVQRTRPVILTALAAVLAFMACARRIPMAWPTNDMYATLGIRPQLGRLPVPEDNDDAILISDRMWNTWFGRDPSVVGPSPVRAGRHQ